MEIVRPTLIDRLAAALIVVAVFGLVLVGRPTTGSAQLVADCAQGASSLSGPVQIDGTGLHERASVTSGEHPGPTADPCCGKLCGGGLTVPVVPGLAPAPEAPRPAIVPDDVRTGIEPNGLLRPPKPAPAG